MLTPWAIAKNVLRLLLVAAVVLICFLSAVIAVNYSRDPGFRIGETTTRMVKIGMASQEYFRVQGQWPDSINSIVRDSRWKTVQTNDAWGQELQYIPFNRATGRGAIISHGDPKKRAPNGVRADH